MTTTDSTFVDTCSVPTPVAEAMPATTDAATVDTCAKPTAPKTKEEPTSEINLSAKVIRLLRPKVLACDENYTKNGDDNLVEQDDTMEMGYYNYLGEDKNYYWSFHGNGTNCFIPKKYAKIEIWTPAKGKGFIYFHNDSGKPIALKEAPSSSSKTIKVFHYTEDDIFCLDKGQCLGVKGEWYKVKYNNKIGYVKAKEVEWTVDFACVQEYAR